MKAFFLVVCSLVVFADEANNFTRGSQQGVKEFLTASAPKDRPQISHFTPKPLKFSEGEILIGVYEPKSDGETAGDDSQYRQFAYGFFAKDGSLYRRLPVGGLFDDGGSPREVLAVFTAKFEKGSSPQLAVLTKWDSSRAGGHSVMTNSGIFYEVEGYAFDGSEFKKLKLPIFDELNSCDCTQFDDNGNEKGHTRAKAKDVAGVKRLLGSLGIKQ